MRMADLMVLRRTLPPRVGEVVLYLEVPGVSSPGPERAGAVALACEVTECSELTDLEKACSGFSRLVLLTLLC